VRSSLARVSDPSDDLRAIQVPADPTGWPTTAATTRCTSPTAAERCSRSSRAAAAPGTSAEHGAGEGARGGAAGARVRGRPLVEAVVGSGDRV